LRLASDANAKTEFATLKPREPEVMGFVTFIAVATKISQSGGLPI
jgi:hypothetical protein